MPRLATIFCLPALLLFICGATAAENALHWEPLHEPACGGWITGFQFNPNNPQRILVTGDMLGAGLSEDGGESWQPTFGFKSWELGDATWSDTDPSIVWIGAVSGPYLSTNEGRNWTLKREGMPPPLGFGNSSPIEKILIDPHDPHHLLAFGGSSRRWDDHGKGAMGVVWESRDLGDHWTRLTTLTADGSSTAPEARGFNIISAAHACGGIDQLYAAVDAHGIYVSTDGGKTWTVRNDGLPTHHPERVIAHPSERNTVFCSLGNEPMPNGGKDFQPGGIFKSTDAGIHWEPLNNGLQQNVNVNGNFTARYKAFAICASNPDVMYAADDSWYQGGIFATKDGGHHWTECKLEFPRFFPAAAPGTVMAVDPKNPDIAWCLGAEHMLQTRDGGEHWEDAGNQSPAKTKAAWRGTGYSGMCATQVRFNDSVPGEAMIQALDSGRAWLSRDGLKTWTRYLTEPDPWGGGDDTSFAGAKVIYATTSREGFTGIGRSSDAGGTWVLLAGKSHGLPELHARADAFGILASPKSPGQVWACIGGILYHSSDQGENWSVVHRGPGLKWIAADPTSSERFYVTGERNVYVVQNGRITPIGGPHVAGRIAVDSRGRVLVTANGGGRAGVWRYDGSWTRLLDDPYIEGVAVDPKAPHRILISTNQNPYLDFCNATGIWASDDDGKSWSQQNDGLPTLRGSVLAFDPYVAGQIIFGTLGRGFFRSHWPSVPKLVPTRSYVSTNDDAKFAAVDATPEPVAPHDRLRLLNPGMDAGTEEPSGWTERSGSAIVRRDTHTYHTGPASLLLDHSAKDGAAVVGQMLSCSGGVRVKIGGWIKASGHAKVNLLLQSYSESGNCIDTQQVRFAMNESDWSHGEKEVTLPSNARRFGINLLIEGDGKAWLDDVTLESDDVQVEIVRELPAEKPRVHSPEEPSDPARIPVTPTPGFYDQFPDAWLQMHEKNLDRVKRNAGPLDVLLLGDSITLGWGGGWDGQPPNEIWQKNFGDLRSLNLGIGGDKTQNVLWRIEHGELDGLAPRIVLLAIGVNNVWNWKVPPAAVADGVKLCVEKVHAKLPSAKIIVINIFPNQENPDAPNRKRTDEIRKAIAKLGLDNHAAIRFADFGDKFLQADRTISREMMGDFLHPTIQGYKIYANEIARYLRER